MWLLYYMYVMFYPAATGVGVAFGASHTPVAKSVSGVPDLKSSSNQTLQQQKKACILY